MSFLMTFFVILSRGFAGGRGQSQAMNKMGVVYTCVLVFARKIDNASANSAPFLKRKLLRCKDLDTAEWEGGTLTEWEGGTWLLY